jgi:hypothetical protein
MNDDRSSNVMLNVMLGIFIAIICLGVFYPK